MMSYCTVCRAATDLALSDVLTNEQSKQLGGIENVPLIGTCGDDECVWQQVTMLRAMMPRGTNDNS